MKYLEVEDVVFCINRENKRMLFIAFERHTYNTISDEEEAKLLYEEIKKKMEEV